MQMKRGWRVSAADGGKRLQSLVKLYDLSRCPFFYVNTKGSETATDTACSWHTRGDERVLRANVGGHDCTAAAAPRLQERHCGSARRQRQRVSTGFNTNPVGSGRQHETAPLNPNYGASPHPLPLFTDYCSGLIKIELNDYTQVHFSFFIHMDSTEDDALWYKKKNQRKSNGLNQISVVIRVLVRGRKTFSTRVCTRNDMPRATDTVQLPKYTAVNEQNSMQHKRGAQRLHLRFVDGAAEHAADEGAKPQLFLLRHAKTPPAVAL